MQRFLTSCQSNRLREIAALLEEPGQCPIERGILRVFLPSLIEHEDSVIDQAAGVRRLGHVHLSAQVPGAFREQTLAIEKSTLVIPATLGGFELGPQSHRRQEREPTAAKVVMVLCLLISPQRLAKQKVARIEFAARQQQLNRVIEVAAAGDLAGTVQPLRGDSARLWTNAKVLLGGCHNARDQTAARN